MRVEKACRTSWSTAKSTPGVLTSVAPYTGCRRPTANIRRPSLRRALRSGRLADKARGEGGHEVCHELLKFLEKRGRTVEWCVLTPSGPTPDSQLRPVARPEQTIKPCNLYILPS